MPQPDFMPTYDVRCHYQTWAWCSAGTSISTTVRLLLLVVMIYGVSVRVSISFSSLHGSTSTHLVPVLEIRPLRESSRGAGQVSRHASRRGIRCAFKNFETLGIASQPPLRISRRSNTLHGSPRPTGTGRSISIPNVYNTELLYLPLPSFVAARWRRIAGVNYACIHPRVQSN